MRKTAAFLPLLLLAALLPTGAATGSCQTSPPFTDACAHESVLHVWDTPTLDLLILPPASPYAVRDTALVLDAVDAWTEGVEAFGPSWLADGLSIRPHVLGHGLPAGAVVRDAEIVVATAEANPVLLFGTGMQDPLGVCGPGGFASLSAPHHHEGSAWTVRQATCDDGGYRCLALSTNFLWLPDAANARDLQDLSAHELGHCLGLGDVGDDGLLGVPAGSPPLRDIMGHDADSLGSDHIRCVSNLNVRVLEGIFARVLGRPTSEWLSPGDDVAMETGYTQVACPDAAPLPLTATPPTSPPVDGQGGCTLSSARMFAACSFACLPGVLHIEGSASDGSAVFHSAEAVCGDDRASCTGTNSCSSSGTTGHRGVGTCQARVRDPAANNGWTLRCWTEPSTAPTGLRAWLAPPG